MQMQIYQIKLYYYRFKQKYPGYYVFIVISVYHEAKNCGE